MRKLSLIAFMLALFVACDQETQETAPQGPTNQQVEPQKQQ